MSIYYNENDPKAAAWRERRWDVKGGKINLQETQVFTPAWAAKDLCNMACWDDPATFFFEPSCGDGAMIPAALDSIYDAALRRRLPLEMAVAETLHKFFAIELDEELVPKARERVWFWAIGKLGPSPDWKLLAEGLAANCIRDAIQCREFFGTMDAIKRGMDMKGAQRGDKGGGM